jgi:hypothetical protein
MPLADVNINEPVADTNGYGVVKNKGGNTKKWRRKMPLTTRYIAKRKHDQQKNSRAKKRILSET